MSLRTLANAVHLADVASEALFQLDEKLNITFINQVIRDFLGYQPHELVGKSFLSLFPMQNRAAVEGALLASAKAGGVLSVRVPIVSKEGVVMGGHLKAVPVELPGGGRGFIGSIIPKHKSHLAEEILEALDTGVALVERSGRVLYANSYARNQISQVIEILKRTGGAEGEGEIQLDERTYWYLIKRFSREPSLRGFIVLSRDITEIKKMREMMTMVDRLSSLGIVAASIAHEVKNPLAGIRLLAQTLAREIPERDKREYALRIVRQVDRIDAMIKKLLSYAKPKPARARPVKLSVALDDVLSLVSDRIKKQGINLELRYDRNLELVADPAQLQQILLNLVLNALDVMPEGGTLEIEAGESNIISPELGVPYVYIKVRDTGPGIPQASLQKIFYPFYSTKPGGTGLGLFVVYQLVKENGGMVEVESQEGEGTTFTLYFKPARRRNGSKGTAG